MRAQLYTPYYPPCIPVSSHYMIALETDGRADGRTDGRTILLTSKLPLFIIYLCFQTQMRENLRHFYDFTNGTNGLETDGWRDGRTDGWTDTPTDRDARTHLKRRKRGQMQDSTCSYRGLLTCNQNITKICTSKSRKILFFYKFYGIPNRCNDLRTDGRTCGGTYGPSDGLMGGRWDLQTDIRTFVRKNGLLEARTNHQIKM